MPPLPNAQGMLQPFSPGAVVFPGGPPNKPSQLETCDADRMVLAGGALATNLLDPSVKPLSRIFRKVPTPSIFQASRQRPTTLVLGAFTVPVSMVLVLQGALIRPYRFDSVAPGDAVPVEPRRLALSLGYDLTISVAGRLGNLEAELIPGDPEAPDNVNYPVTPAQMVGFPDLPSRSANGDGLIAPTPAAHGEFLGPSLVFAQPDMVSIPANATPVSPRQFVLQAAAGGALQPQTQDLKQGPPDMPFTYLVYEGQSVTLSAVAWNRIRIPLAFIEGELVGYLVPKTWIDSLMKRMRPCE